MKFYVFLVLLFSTQATINSFASGLVKLQWKPVPKANHYVFRISQSSDFKKIIFQKETSEAFIHWSVNAVGTYYWNVITVDDNGRKSTPSGTGVIEVRAQFLQPKAMPPALLKTEQTQHPLATNKVPQLHTVQRNPRASWGTTSYVKLSWEETEKEERAFELDLAEVETFSPILETIETRHDSFKVEAKHGKKYYWRVRALFDDNGGFAQSPTETFQLERIPRNWDFSLSWGYLFSEYRQTTKKPVTQYPVGAATGSSLIFIDASATWWPGSSWWGVTLETMLHQVAPPVGTFLVPELSFQFSGRWSLHYLVSLRASLGAAVISTPLTETAGSQSKTTRRWETLAIQKAELRLTPPSLPVQFSIGERLSIGLPAALIFGPELKVHFLIRDVECSVGYLRLQHKSYFGVAIDATNRIEVDQTLQAVTLNVIF